MPDFRILSLDGGGTWASIQVMALIDLYGADAPARCTITPRGAGTTRRTGASLNLTVVRRIRAGQAVGRCTWFHPRRS